MVAEAKRLIDYEEALRLVLEHRLDFGTERLALAQLLGRHLVEPIRAVGDMPAFDNSAVDGYAVRADDLTGGRALRLAGEMQAGTRDALRLGLGECVRVFTGAPLPLGTSAVAMQEDVVVSGCGISLAAPLAEGENIRRQGSELSKGDVVVRPGVLNPASIGAIAAAGVAEAWVHGLPRVGIVVTGDELARPGQAPERGQVFESNGTALRAALLAMGISDPIVRYARDSADATRDTLAPLLKSCDLILTTGGVSVGDYDVVRPALRELGVDEVFWRVAIKPGKPVYFGRTANAAIFGLPGNPVSALVTFFLFVRPYLLGSAGPPGEVLPLVDPLRKKAGRTEFVPCRIAPEGAVPFAGRASHKASCLAEANGLIVLPKEMEACAVGEPVEVIRLRWGWEA